ncbi:hypothetical protein HPG69_014482, partial [Diceros bicornis minor]
ALSTLGWAGFEWTLWITQNICKYFTFQESGPEWEQPHPSASWKDDWGQQAASGGSLSLEVAGCEEEFPRGCEVPAVHPVLSGLSRTINGEDAVPCSWPWQRGLGGHRRPLQCHMRAWADSGLPFQIQWGAGSRAYVQSLTPMTSHQVMTSEFDQGSDENVQVLKIAKVFKNPNYSSLTNRNDVALLKLASSACLSNTMSPVCLPSADGDFPAGTLSVTMGGGKTKDTSEHDVAFPPRSSVWGGGCLGSGSLQVGSIWLFLGV